MTGKPKKIVFHHSVIGESHRRKGTPCQDASASFAPDGRDVRIAAVADGHGDPTCLRSERGAAFAVSAAVDCLQEFAAHYPNLASIEDEGRFRTEIPVCLRQLTDAIVSRWSAMTRADVRANGLTEKEYSSAGPFESQYRRGEYLERAYGCTLIAALEAGDYLLLLQQGDGRCDILRGDGTTEQPIPEDERCYGNVTTSLSDDFAAREIRSVLLSGREAESVACLLSSDGVENGFYEEEDVLRFFLDVAGRLMETPGDEYSGVLESMLNDVSVHGNGDDVSLAGFIDPEGLAVSAAELQKVMEKNQMEDARIQVESKLISMERKMEVLMGNVRNAAPEELDARMRECMEYRVRYNQMKAKARELAKE